MYIKINVKGNLFLKKCSPSLLLREFVSRHGGWGGGVKSNLLNLGGRWHFSFDFFLSIIIDKENVCLKN